MHLIDNHGREIKYMRLAITDRCNLRCFYCMPAHGIDWLPKSHLLSYEEMLRLCRIVTEMGINKIRITGGEPFLRKDLMTFLNQLVELPGLDGVHITTNGVLTGQYLKELKSIGITSLNLSLDTLDRDRFNQITRRDEFDTVMTTFHRALDLGFELKVNCVVMEGKNIEDVLPLVELSQNHNISVRFIEEMPFNGDGHDISALKWNNRKILETIKEKYPHAAHKPAYETSTAAVYQIPGFEGDFGIIAAYSRTFCGTCDRIRVTAQGDLRTCLYGDNEISLRDLLRESQDNDFIKRSIQTVIQSRAKDGFAAEKAREEKNPLTESMSTIGG